MKQPIKMNPGDELHLTALMAPFSLNLVTGQDRQHLLGYGRAAFEAGKAGQCLHQIQEPEADIWPCVNIDVDESGKITNAKLYSPGLPAGNHDVYPVRVPYMDEHTEAWRACVDELEKAVPGFMSLGNMNGIECAVAAIRGLSERAKHQELAAAEQAAWHAGLDEGRAQAAPAAVAVPDLQDMLRELRVQIHKITVQLAPTSDCSGVWMAHDKMSAALAATPAAAPGKLGDDMHIRCRKCGEQATIEYNSARIVTHNPHTGKPRDSRDIASDPEGKLITKPGADLIAAAAPVVPKWIDDPHDIEQGQMLNPEWVKAQKPAAAPVALPEPDFWVRPGATIHPDRGWQCWSNDGTATGAFHADTVRALLAGVSAPAAVAVLDYPWRDRLLDGRELVRDQQGFAEHSELPLLDEGMKPRAFFAALGVEMKHTMADDDLSMDEYDAMSDAENWSAWIPRPPIGDAWNLVAIFDTEDGPAAWWARALKESREASPQAQADARDAEQTLFLQESDQHLLHRFIETTEDDESYDIGKEAVKRLAELGVISNHGFGRYSVTMFGYWAHEQFWHQNPSLPLKTNADRDSEARAAIAAQAAQQGGAA